MEKLICFIIPNIVDAVQSMAPSVVFLLFLIVEPALLIGEGEYNLNVLKEIKVTESFIGMDKKISECQTEDSFYNCETRHYLEAILAKCKCLPVTMRLSNEVT